MCVFAHPPEGGAVIHLPIPIPPSYRLSSESPYRMHHTTLIPLCPNRIPPSPKPSLQFLSSHPPYRLCPAALLIPITRCLPRPLTPPLTDKLPSARPQRATKIDQHSDQTRSLLSTRHCSRGSILRRCFPWFWSEGKTKTADSCANKKSGGGTCKTCRTCRTCKLAKNMD